MALVSPMHKFLDERLYDLIRIFCLLSFLAIVSVYSPFCTITTNEGRLEGRVKLRKS